MKCFKLLNPSASQKMMTTEKGGSQTLSTLKVLVAFGYFYLMIKVLDYKSFNKYNPIGHTLFFPEQMEDFKNNIVNKIQKKKVANYLKSATFSKYNYFGE